MKISLKLTISLSGKNHTLTSPLPGFFLRVSGNYCKKEWKLYISMKVYKTYTFYVVK